MKKSRGYTSSKMIPDLCSRNVFSYLFAVGDKIRPSCSFCLFFCGLQGLKRNQARVYVIAVFVWSVVIRYFFVHILFSKQKLGWNDFCKVYFFFLENIVALFSVYTGVSIYFQYVQVYFFWIWEGCHVYHWCYPLPFPSGLHFLIYSLLCHTVFFL